MNDEDEARRQRGRKLEESILRPVCAALDIEEDVASLGLHPLRQYSEVLPGAHIFMISGTGEDYWRMCAYTPKRPGKPFLELFPPPSELNVLLASYWETLPAACPVLLADLVLAAQSVSVSQRHEVLTEIAAIQEPSRREEGYVLTEEADLIASEGEHRTTREVSDDWLTLRALTLHGGYYQDGNLGYTEIRLSRNGVPEIGERETLCDPVFSKKPMIWY